MIKNGILKRVCVDDNFPVKNAKSAMLSFTRNNSHELWVAILEKAYAKLHGNYEDIEGG